MALPKTFIEYGDAGFDVFDWYRLAASTTDHPPSSFDALLSDTTDGLLVQSGVYTSGLVSVVGDNLSFSGTGASDAQAVYTTAVSGSFTYEFAIQLSAASRTPATLASNMQIAIGVIDAQGSLIRIYFSQEGIGYLTTPTGVPQLLSASAPLIEYGRWITCRIINREATLEVRLQTDGLTETKNENYYITPSFTGMGIKNAVDICCTKAEVTVGSLRLSSIKLIPNESPTAVITTPAFVAIDRLTKLSGENSSDPEGSTLTYDWEILGFPGATPPLLEGLVAASTTVTDGVTDFFTVQTSNQGKAGNNYRLVTSVGVLSLTDSVVLGLTYLNAVVPATMNNKQLVQAINNSVAWGQDEAISEKYSAELVAGYTGMDPVPVNTFTFSGGIDSTLKEPTFVPYTAGVYTLGLTVNDGDLDSEQDLVTITALQSDHVLGSIPDASIVWSSISDVWQHIQGDRLVFESIWSSMMPVVSGEMLKVKTRMCFAEVTDRFPLVDLAVVPNDDDVPAKVSEQIAEKPTDLLASDVVIVQLVVETHSLVARTDRQSGNDRYPVMLVAVAGLRCLPTGRPGFADGAHQHEPGFVDEDEVGAQVRSPFFMRGHSSSFQRWMRSSLRSRARRSGFWQLQFRRCMRRPTWSR